MSHSKLFKAACIGVFLFFILPKFTKGNYCETNDCTIEDVEDDFEDIQTNHTPESTAFDTAHLAVRRRSLILVSTIDGVISAINPEDGSVIWRQETGPGPMLSSSISQIELISKGKWARLIPSLDGGLYTFDGESVDAVPVTAENLLKASFMLNEDLVISGGKESRVYGVNLQSGRVQYVCGMNGCSNFAEEASLANELLVLKRSTQTVRAIERRTGAERWNFSVGQHELEYISEVDDSLPCSLDAPSLDPGVKIVVPDGLIYGFNPVNPTTLVWKKKLKSPIVHAWLLNNRQLKQLNLLNPELVPALHPKDGEVDFPKPVMYVGLHNRMLYVQESASLKNEIDEAIQSLSEAVDKKPEYPRVEWKPFKATAHTRIPAIAFDDEETDLGGNVNCPEDHSSSSETSLSADASLQKGYPDDTGFYLFEYHSPNRSTDEEFIEEFWIVPPWYYHWKEVLLSCIISSLVVHLIYTRGIERQLRFEFGRQVNRGVMANIPFIAAMFARQVRQRRLEQASQDENGNNPACKKTDVTTSVSIVTAVVDTGSTPSQRSNLSRGSSGSEEEYKSRYLTDFTTVSCLGRGGFGIVFEAKNQVDECSYAVKRIRLPNRPAAREKVMREVKALAKLDHPYIVRYFNAWLETPPIGWQENHDARWIQSEVSEPAAYEDSCTDRNLSIITSNPPPFPVNKDPNPFRLCELSDAANEISIPINSCSDDDDYIVFGDDVDGNVKNDHSCLSRYDCAVQISSENSQSVSEGLSVSGDLGVSKSSSGRDSEWSKVSKRKDMMLLPLHNKHEWLQKDEPSEASKTTADGPKLFLYIQMQLCKKESLREWLRERQSHRDPFQVFNMFNQILHAVEYVHLQGLIHRDLKPSNIFFSQDGQIKVGDFGLVTAMAEDEEPQTPVDGENFKFNPMIRHTDKVGTQLYMSPEQKAGKPYNHKVDIYSLGLIFFELLTPFKTQMEQVRTLMDLKNFKFPPEFERKHPEETVLLKMMLSHNPDERPTTIGIRSRPPLVNLQDLSILEYPEYMHFSLQRQRSSTRNDSTSSK